MKWFISRDTAHVCQNPEPATIFNLFQKFYFDEVNDKETFSFLFDWSE